VPQVRRAAASASAAAPPAASSHGQRRLGRGAVGAVRGHQADGGRRGQGVADRGVEGADRGHPLAAGGADRGGQATAIAAAPGERAPGGQRRAQLVDVRVAVGRASRGRAGDDRGQGVVDAGLGSDRQRGQPLGQPGRRLIEGGDRGQRVLAGDHLV
jgi:hypothetical protein